MPLKLVERRGCDSGHLRGSVRGVIVDESTKVTDKVLAESMRVKREWEIDHTPNRSGRSQDVRASRLSWSSDVKEARAGSRDAFRQFRPHHSECRLKARPFARSHR